MKTLLCLLLLISFGCTSGDKALPNEALYEKNSQELVLASAKLADEPSAARLHQVALALDQTRTLACDDFNGECNMFAEFLTRAIKLSAKGSLSEPERAELHKRAADIQAAVESGKRKLHQEWQKRSQK